MKKPLFFLLLLLIAYGTSYGQEKLTLQALKDSIVRIMEAEHMPGLMMALVTRDSLIWQGGLGVASLEDKTPVTDQTLFRIGSVSKTFVSLGIQQLVAAKKFSLDSKLKDIAPEIAFSNPWETDNPVRVIHLLEHTAGFDDMHFAAMLNRSGQRVPALKEVEAHGKSLTSRWPPGTRSSYSNPDYVILGYLIEKFSGTPYQAYIKKEILDPLGMTGTVFAFEVAPPYATGYYWDGKFLKSQPIKITGEGAGAISSNAADMARYVRMYLNDGKLDSARVVGAGAINEMEHQHSSVAAAAGLKTGYGLGNHSGINGGELKQYFRGHNGGIMGFVSDFYYSRELGVGYVISNNGETSNNKIKDVIVSFLTQSKSQGAPPKVPLDKNKIAKWVGTYQRQNPRNELISFMESLMGTTNVSIEGDTVHTTDFLGDETSWVPVKENLFRKENEVVPNMVFSEVGGTPVIDRRGDFYVKINPLVIWLLRVIFFLAVLTGVILVPLSVFWLIQSIQKKISWIEGLKRCYNLLALMSLVGLMAAFFNLVIISNIHRAGDINGTTVFIFLASLFIPGFSLLALGDSVVNFKSRKPTLRYFLLISSISFFTVSLYLFSYGWVGMRLWAY